MGRELKRVPMDFNAPLDKVWEGYKNPYYAQRIRCTDCDETGYAPQARLFMDQWYGHGSEPFDAVAYGSKPLTIDSPDIRAEAERHVMRSPEFYGYGEHSVQREIRRLFELWRNAWSHQLSQVDVDALVEGGRLWDFTRVPRNEEQESPENRFPNGWLKESNGYTPTADEVNSWSFRGFGHDSTNQYVCVKARCEREGVLHICPTCDGQGYLWPTEDMGDLYENWTADEPPMGEGYQLWETTSEGSPQSPVFATLDELCAWCENNATTFGSNKTTAIRWKEMLDDGFVAHTEGNMVFV